jgi:hypothetical protein
MALPIDGERLSWLPMVSAVVEEQHVSVEGVLRRVLNLR